MPLHTETIYLLSRINAHQERTIELLLGLQERINAMSTRPPPRNQITTSDVIRFCTAGVILWLALTGRVTPADVLAILR